jgi:hypothetical protein
LNKFTGDLSMITSESARYLMARTNLAFEHPELAASLGDAAKCWSCKIGLNVGLGAVIAAAIAAAAATGGPAPTPEAAVTAAATGLSEAAVVEILSSAAGGTAAVELMIEELCKAMGAYN